MISNNLSITLIPVYILRLISTVSFGVFYSSLSLLLIHAFSMSNEASISLAALFFGFHYTMPLIGGRLIDEVKNFKQMFILGKLFQLFSSLVLIYSINNKQYLSFGLSLFLIDSMVSSVSLNMLITNCFDSNDSDLRRIAFLKGHIWSNLGFILAFFVSGAIYYFTDIKFLLYASAIFSILTIAYCYFFIIQKTACVDRKYLKNSFNVILIIIISSFIITEALISYYLTREIILISAAILVCFVFINTIKSASKKESSNILKFLFFLICSIVFWTIYMLSPILMPIFIDSGVDTVILGINISPQWLQMLCPIIGVSVGSTVSRILSNSLKTNSTVFGRASFFISALLCTFLALSLINLGVNQHALGVKLNYGWVICYLAIMSVGELLLAPASMALVGDYIPKRHQGIYTGINQMVIGLSVILAGLLSQYILSQSYGFNQIFVNNYRYIFALMSLGILIICGMLFRFDRLLSQSEA